MIGMLGLQSYTTIHMQGRLSYIQVHVCILYRLWTHACVRVYVQASEWDRERESSS